MLQFNCPNCGKFFETEDSYAGGQIICTACTTHFYIPEIHDIEDVIVEYDSAPEAERSQIAVKRLSSDLFQKIIVFLIMFLVCAAFSVFYITVREKQIRQKYERNFNLRLMAFEGRQDDKEYILSILNEVKLELKRVAEANHNRGQTFGTRLDRLQTEYLKSVQLFRGGKYSECEKKLNNIELLINWIDINAPLRGQVQKFLYQLDERHRKGGWKPSIQEKSLEKKIRHDFMFGNFDAALQNIERFVALKK